GMTIHSWGAVTPGSNDIDSQIKCIRTCKPALHRWKSVKVLIIDEGRYPSSVNTRYSYVWHLSVYAGRAPVRHINQDSR
ncbi:hypothetical protein PISMIDRAFT_110943, partial [Pisolithus microcarpus 441]